MSQGNTEFQFRRPDVSSNWEKFSRTIYDSSTKKFLGRTRKNWGQLLLFYTIFFAILAALFAISMEGLFFTLTDKEPKWKLEHSIIGTNPGLGFRPISNKTEDGSLISYNVSNHITVNNWVSLVDNFLKPYKGDQKGENFVSCGFDNPPSNGKVCTVQLSSFGKCTKDNGYGYNSTSPCVFLKLNRIYGWQPEYYTEPAEDMPDDLKVHIENIKNVHEKKQVWVSCAGEDDADKELVADFDYQPRGFAGYFYPYNNTKNYLSPLIAVSILKPKPNVVITIECRAWAKNIQYKGGSRDRQGSVKFEILIESEDRVVSAI